ncbi:Lrp/AsnC family transcriptional regulator [Chengkuizengella sediminis]|uniref:Lrp/AsnC family transcriptional regulator n=1 Tax=Chengkuizengella sediminis TaxID=1885917 RepID=UPI0013894C1D|nr:Lrp/AsnC family transcriptional regulator [Chengkuizengella sediminis]NDI36064.1 Lrp/AsnC family transcriptional regulator [Chengkuizengella sediminis]
MIDNTDEKILEELLKNGRITMKELGEKVHLTGQATASRVVKLEEEGVIEGYTINLNQGKSGYSIHSFINIFTKNPSHKAFLSFAEEKQKYILNHFKITGESCYLLECRFPSNDELDQFLTELNIHANYKLAIVINKKN